VIQSATGGVTACVIARDEEHHLPEVLPTLRWADEVLVVVNTETTDRSAEVARKYADRVEVRPFSSFPVYRNTALDLAHCAWVFFVDADERVSAELAAEVQRVLAAEVNTQDRTAGWWIPRRNVIFGHTMQGAGWFPDYQLRLLERCRARYDESRPVHEVVELRGPSGHLTTPLLHLNYQSLGQFVHKQRRYTSFEARELLAKEGRPSHRALAGRPAREFWRRYVALAGWRDGWVGLFLCAAMAFYAFERVRQARAL